MKKVNVDQGSKEWLDWRRTVITGTDCPSIMGTSKYQTAYKCWQRKLGLVEEQYCNAAMARGKKLEPVARDAFIKETGINMTPVVVESTEYDFLGASLDGISECSQALLEIKCGNEKLHNMAKEGHLPNYYMDQIQHQLLVTDRDLCYYYSFNGKEGAVVEVKKDPEFKDRFLPKAKAFWKGIVYFEPPSLTMEDFCNMNDNLDWQKYAKMYQEIDASTKALEDKKDYLRKKIIELCADNSSYGAGIKAMKTTVKGRIAYDEIPEIKGVDLEQYRKESSSCWKILIEK